MVKPFSILMMMMNRRVNNPFKEKQNSCIRYAVLLCVALGLVMMVGISNNTKYNGLSATVVVPNKNNSKKTNTGSNNDHGRDTTTSEKGDQQQRDSAPRLRMAKGLDGLKLQIDKNKESGEDEARNHGVIDKQGKREQDDKDKDEELVQGSFDLVEQDKFGSWVKKYLRRLKWPPKSSQSQSSVKKQQQQQLDHWLLNREILLESVRLGCTNIAENQLSEGNFNYQYHFVKRSLDHEDNDVRQAGALWGISLCYQFDPSNQQYQEAVEKAIRFFISRSVPGPKDGTLLVRYPDHSARLSPTGTNALFGLGMLEYLRTVTENTKPKADSETDKDFIQQVRLTLEGIIGHLEYMQLPNKHFGQSYRFDSNDKVTTFSPYFDGETMLCLVKAAKYLEGFGELIPLIEETAPILAKTYSIDTWASDRHDSDRTKGFYQWGSMFLTEYYQSGWLDADMFGDFVLMLSHWIIHTHEILLRPKNTGYAFEGIISAYEIAKDRKDEDMLQRLQVVIDQGLYKLSTWQVGGPLADKNPFLVKHPTSEKIAIGGIMGSKDGGDLRIDTTQHQMHALIMALTTVYTK